MKWRYILNSISICLFIFLNATVIKRTEHKWHQANIHFDFAVLFIAKAKGRFESEMKRINNIRKKKEKKRVSKVEIS